MEAAINENNQQIIIMLHLLSQRLDKLEADMEALKKTVELHTKNPPSTPLPADIFISPSSIKKAKKDIVRYLN